MTVRARATPPGAPVRAFVVSLGLHGGALAAAVALVAAHGSPIRDPAAPSPAVIVELAARARTDVDVVPAVAPSALAAAAAAIDGPDAIAPAVAGSGAPGHLIRRGHPHSLSYAPLEANPYAELQVSYDAPGGGTATGGGDADAGLGAALHGTGLGAGGASDGPGGGLDTPPPPASHRKPVEPRRYYTSWKFHDVRMLVGETVQAELIIDPRGLVHDVRITKHVNPWVDQQATRLAHRFVFFPALNDAGEPTWGSFPWTFRITG